MTCFHFIDDQRSGGTFRRNGFEALSEANRFEYMVMYPTTTRFQAVQEQASILQTSSQDSFGSPYPAISRYLMNVGKGRHK